MGEIADVLELTAANVLELTAAERRRLDEHPSFDPQSRGGAGLFGH